MKYQSPSLFPSYLSTNLKWLKTTALVIVAFYLWLELSNSVRPISAQAQVITEVYPAPITGENEWLEIFNPDQTDIELSGWSIYDQLSSPSLIHQFESTTLPANQYLKIDLSSAKLNNSGDGVTILDSAGQVVDQTSYTGASSGLSWSKVDESWDWTEPTPGAPNATIASPEPSPSITPDPSPTSTPIPSATPSPSPSPANYPTTQLLLTEIHACPSAGSKEWIEIFNQSTETISLTGWQLADSNATIARIEETKIAAHQYQVVELATAKLNNDGDTVTLIAPDSTVAFSETYESCTIGLSLIKQQGIWSSASPSKGGENPQPTAEQSHPTSSEPPVPEMSTTTLTEDLGGLESTSRTQLSKSRSALPVTLTATPLTTGEEAPPASPPDVTTSATPGPFIQVISGGLLVTSSGIIMILDWWQRSMV